MPIINPFDTDAFNMASLTKSINILPNMYGRIRELNLMPFRGVPTRTIIVEEKNGVLSLLPTMPVGSPGTVGKTGKRKARSFVIPHIPHDDVILPDEYQDVRAFGSETELETLTTIMNNKLQTMKNKHSITLEHLRMGALKGVILDADGSSVLYNLYTEFEIAANSVDFLLGTATTNVTEKCREVLRLMEDNLKGEVMNGVRALVSREFFDKLISHDNVEKFYLNHQEALNLTGNGMDPRKGFAFGGIIFEEYAANANDPEGNNIRFIAEAEGHAFPTGTMNSFETIGGPADFLETANTIGLPIYAKQEPRNFNRGVDLHTQSNRLPICYRPALLVKVHTSN